MGGAMRQLWNFNNAQAGLFFTQISFRSPLDKATPAYYDEFQ
jgi:hypothetical protein